MKWICRQEVKTVKRQVELKEQYELSNICYLILSKHKVCMNSIIIIQVYTIYIYIYKFFFTIVDYFHTRKSVREMIDSHFPGQTTLVF